VLSLPVPHGLLCGECSNPATYALRGGKEGGNLKCFCRAHRPVRTRCFQIEKARAGEFYAATAVSARRQSFGKELAWSNHASLQMQILRLSRHAGCRRQANDSPACKRLSQRHVHRAFFSEWARVCEAFKLKKELARALDEEAELGSRHGEVFSGKEQADSCLLIPDSLHNLTPNGLFCCLYFAWSLLTLKPHLYDVSQREFCRA
jgi:hypothetical protein